jgi:hypothetical protein
MALIPDVSNQHGIEDRSTRIRGRKQGTWERKNRSRHHGWFLEEEEEYCCDTMIFDSLSLPLSLLYI